MKKKYPDSIMMKTDTDSLCYLIKTEDLYDDLKNDESLQKQIEFSNYPTNHPLYNCDRKKQVGIFQDECVSGKMAVISEYVGLRAKCYANELYMLEKEKYVCKKKAKGVPTRHTDKRLSFEDYKNCRENKVIITLGDKTAEKEEHRETISSFRSLKLTTYSIEQTKIALSGNDDKRYILPDNNHTLALGHYRIPLYKEKINK